MCLGLRPLMWASYCYLLIPGCVKYCLLVWGKLCSFALLYYMRGSVSTLWGVSFSICTTVSYNTPNCRIGETTPFMYKPGEMLSLVLICEGLWLSLNLRLWPPSRASYAILFIPGCMLSYHSIKVQGSVEPDEKMLRTLFAGMDQLLLLAGELSPFLVTSLFRQSSLQY